jgi:hypothetical protein
VEEEGKGREEGKVAVGGERRNDRRAWLKALAAAVRCWLSSENFCSKQAQIFSTFS